MPSPAAPYAADYDQAVTPTVVISTVVAGLALIYHLLQGITSLPPLWEVMFVSVPGALLGPGAKEQLQRAFGTSGRGVGEVVARVRNRAASIVGGPLIATGSDDGHGLVGGLWNSGNTCYQNSVLQALASLSNLLPHLTAMVQPEDGDFVAETPSAALSDLISSLNELTPNARASYPSPVIVRGTEKSGWTYNEQQDAQEFFQNLTGALEKEMSRLRARRRWETAAGLEVVAKAAGSTEEGMAGKPEGKLAAMPDPTLHSPFEGLLAQRVGCLSCGFVDSISLQPFTSLSLPLPSSWRVSLEECLVEFASMEQIPEVECDKCTLLSIRSKYEIMANNPDSPPELRDTIKSRLRTVEDALENDDFRSDKIPGVKTTGAMKRLSTKTKHIMIARPPPVLVLHTNRSQFDIVTGMAGKNYAQVVFPSTLDLSPFVTRHDALSRSPGTPISPMVATSVEEGGCNLYELKAVVAHYGAHSNGHYYCFRKMEKRWFRISDHEVYPCEEADALTAGNAFMLFYERLDEVPASPTPFIPTINAEVSVVEGQEVEEQGVEEAKVQVEGNGKDEEYELREITPPELCVKEPIKTNELPTPPPSVELETGDDRDMVDNSISETSPGNLSLTSPPTPPRTPVDPPTADSQLEAVPEQVPLPAQEEPVDAPVPKQTVEAPAPEDPVEAPAPAEESIPEEPVRAPAPEEAFTPVRRRRKNKNRKGMNGAASEGMTVMVN